MPVAVFISAQISRATLNLTFCTGLGKPLACKVGVKLSGRLRAGHPHSVLEGPCPAEHSLNTNENTPEPANQGLTRQTRIFQAGRLDLVVAKTTGQWPSRTELRHPWLRVSYLLWPCLLLGNTV